MNNFITKIRLLFLLAFLNIWSFSSGQGNSSTGDRKPDPQSCPKGYDKFEKYCFFISNERLSLPDAERLCASHGGIVAWFSDEEKENAIAHYVAASARRLVSFPSVWLSGIERGKEAKWKSSGTDALYMLNKSTWYLDSPFWGKQPSFLWHVTGIMMSCRDPCIKSQALCESKHELNPTQSSPNDYEYTDYEGDIYDYDYEDGKPDEDVTFDANNILTKGP